MILNKFRNASSSLVIKILFGAIILSFCLWGVGDIIKNYSSSKAVLKVDDAKITVDQFLMEYSQEKQKIRNANSKPLTDDELKKLNVKGMVLDRLIQNTILAQTLNKLNIIVPKKSLADIVHSLPEFQNRGAFDARIYEMALRRSGINEAGFLSQIRENVARTQLIHPITAGYKLPEFIKEVICKEFEAQNTVLVARINVDSMKNDEIPNDETLKQFYVNNPEKYRQPEKRDIAILIINYGKLCSDTTIDEDEINRRYEEVKDSYTQQENRGFERLSFDNGEDANNAWKMMGKGAKTKDIVKKFMARIDSVNNCEITDFPEKIGKELFNLKLNRISSVYPISGTYYIYRLINIGKVKQKTETEIKADIKLELQNEKINSPEFYSKTKEMRNKIDDMFGAGRSIEEISKESGMEIIELKGLTKSLASQKLTKVISDNDTKEEVTENIFSTEELQASQTISSKSTDTLSYIVFVRKIEKAAIPEFEKVATQVKRDFVLEKKDKIAIQKINDIISKKTEASKEVSKLKGVKKFRFSKKDLIMNEKNHSKEVDGILKEIPNANVVLDVISTMKKGEANYYKGFENEYILVAIDKIEKIQEVTPEFKEIINRYLETGVENDIQPVVIEAVKSKANIKIDQKLLEKSTDRNNDERGEEY